MNRWFSALVAVVITGSLAWAANNYRLNTASGTITTFKTTETGGVHVPHVNIDSGGGGFGSAVTAGADGDSNTATGGLNYVRPSWYNGATWDRARGDATNGAFVNVKTSVLPTGAATEATLLSMKADIEAQIPACTTNPCVVIGYTSSDPCTNKTKVNLPISQNGTSSVELKALSGSTVIYVCSIFLMTNSTATTVALTTGTGTACATGNAAVIGSTTANIANSMNLLAGAGFTLGGGHGTVARGAAAGALCMILGANVFVSGNLTYVQE